MARKYPVSRIALALALSAGAMATLPAASVAKEAPAPKISFSPAFQKGAGELDKALTEAQKNPVATGAAAKAQAGGGTPQARAAAGAEVDAALGGIKAKLAALEPSVSTPGDKLKYGDMVRIVGTMELDPGMQHKGSVFMLDSGLLQPAAVPQVQWIAGVTAYQTGDYAGAIPYLKSAVDAGYHDQGGMISAVLADAYKRTNNQGAALQLAQQEVAQAKAAGTKPSETSIRAALQAAYDGKQVGPSTDLAVDLVTDYPSPSAWYAAIGVIRSLLHLSSQDNLDLMRLMAQTGAMNEKHDYLEYIEDLDVRRNPGEALKAIDSAVASGKLTAAELAETRKVGASKIGPDQASLPALERDARAPSAAGNIPMAAGDAYLNYGQYAKAEDMYRIATGKAGVDKDLATLRMGIAQTRQDKLAEAKASFGQVNGVRAPVARLWAAYAASKAAPAPAAPAS
jgi:tetratricopeptide (TPR) repeat protein